MRPALAAMLLAAALAAPGARAAPPEPIAFEPAPRLDLSSRVEWCESDAELDAAAIAAGGCRFAAATPVALARGYSRSAYWLRLTLVNPGPATTERWLRIGHPRLQRVSFFEATDAGDWRRSESGLSVPAARRPVLAVHPILPVTLAPGERRTLLVRVATETSIDLTPTLWLPDAYAGASMKAGIVQTLGIGGLLVIAVFALLIYSRGRNLVYFYFGAGELAKAAFTIAYTGLLPTYLWFDDLSFDVRLLALGGGSAGILSMLFVRSFVGELRRYRRHHGLLLALAASLAAATVWACLIDYGSAIRWIAFLTTAIVTVGALLLWRAWRAGHRPAGFLTVSYCIFLVGHGMAIAVTFGAANFSDLFASLYTWGCLAGAPTALFGLAVHSEDLRRRLAAAQAESAARVEFLARMSHELRTPLDTILGTAQLLTRPDGRTRLAADLADILNSGWRLLRMIDDILDYARGLAGRLTVVPGAVDWPAFLRCVARNAKLLAAENGNAFSLQTSGEAIAGACLDQVRLRQVLDNLLVNAARHTRDGWIRLDCAVWRMDGGTGLRLDFAVTDSGEGIAPADLERIFRPFERGGGSTCRSGKGAGMGLAIARQLVEMMGGRLTVESEPGKGACFRFHVLVDALPANAPAPAAADRPLAAGYAGRRRTILLVEDEAGNRRVLATLLANSGFAVVEAASGREALERCASRTTPIDLVVTDQMMADGDGWMVLKDVAAIRPGVPVVLISAASPRRPAGFPDHLDFAAELMKPLDHAKLLHRIGELLGLAWNEAPVAAETPAGPPIPPDGYPAPAELAALREMVDTGQVSAVLEWAQALAARHPRYAEFAQAVRVAARNLDLARLSALAEADG